MARRLEAVRAHTGFPSIRSFWSKLDEGWTEGSLSYEAARHYHYDRDAPTAYLWRIMEVFPDIRLPYLMAGDGPMTKQEEAAAQAVTKAVEDVAPERPTTLHEHIAPRLTRLVTEGVAGLPSREGYAASWAAPLAELWIEMGGGGEPTILRALAAPLEAFGIDTEGMSDLGRPAFRDYVLQMTPILFRLQVEGAASHRELARLKKDLRDAGYSEEEARAEVRTAAEELAEKLAFQKKYRDKTLADLTSTATQED
ncbi:MAG: hypothetical protein WEA09_13020 [Gemmatimonadota bacterium]